MITTTTKNVFKWFVYQVKAQDYTFLVFLFDSH